MVQRDSDMVAKHMVGVSGFVVQGPRVMTTASASKEEKGFRHNIFVERTWKGMM